MDQSKLQKFYNYVNQIRNNPNSNLFYCTDCINEDLEFKGINYLLVEPIVLYGESDILQKWSPVNDFQLIDQLIRQTQKFDQSQYVIQRITNYFTELKDQILRKIEFCQKQMINHALDLPFGKGQIIKQYQQISQISQLRSLIVESKNNNSLEESIQQKQIAFITELELKKDENTLKLKQILDQRNLNIQSMLIEGKEPIKFDLMSEEKLNEINQYVKHQIEQQNNQNYLEQINNLQLFDISKILESKLNFINMESQQIIKQHIVNTLPFLTNERNFQIIQQQESFDLLNSILEDMVKDLLFR
ncbi:hypothetical protein ABPG72_017622 [Tetrahymena utriculariae]